MKLKLGILTSLILMQSGVAGAANEPQMPVKDIKVGMKGTCQSVFRGTKIEPFEIEVLGLMKGMLGPKQDVILTRLTSENGKFTGVVSGMSGSPCYIDGKLVGALAYRFGALTKEPIAGITPIQTMLDVMKLPRVVPTLPGQRVHYQPRALDKALAQFQPRKLGAGQNTLTPIATPLSFAGMSPTALTPFQTALQNVGFQPTMSGLNNSGDLIDGVKMPDKLVPGGAIAGELVRGDISIAGTGTVTYVDGENVLAFGHPFFGDGYVKIPMATAYITHILVSELGSYKMAQSGNVVGTIVQDRLPAIYGKVGKMTPMIPVKFHIKDSSSVDPKTINLDIVEHPLYSPLFTAVTLNSSLNERLNFNKGGTLKLKAKVELKDGPPIEIEDYYSVDEQGATPILAARTLADKLFTLWDNPFHQPKMKSVDVSVELAPQTRIAMIDEVWTDTEDAKPGDSVTLYVRMKTYRHEEVTRSIKVQVPEDTPNGMLSLFVSDGKSMERLFNSLQTGYESYTSLVNSLQGTRKSDDLHVLLVSDQRGVANGTQMYSELPPSVMELFSQPSATRKFIPLMRSPGEELTVPVGYDIKGQGAAHLYISDQGNNY